MPKTPSYRRRKGYTQAIVTLTDAVTKRRRDYWLGEHGTPASREMYHRVIAAWEANRRRLPRLDHGAADHSLGNSTIAEVLVEYWRWAKEYYHPTRAGAIKSALRILRSYYGHAEAVSFGPSKLRLLRDEMVRGDLAADPPRPSWSRKYVNSQVQCIRHLFKWAAARELLPPSIHQALCTLESLRRGRTTARENPAVKPVPASLLDPTLPYLSRPVRGVVELQLLSGARPGELLSMRPIEIMRDDQARIWTYSPESHKNAYREKTRIIFFGPRAQRIIQPFLRDRPLDAYLFSPSEAEEARLAALHAARRTPLSCGNRPGSNRRTSPRRSAGLRYTTASYQRAIRYACDKAFPPPAPLARRDGETITEWKTRLTTKQHIELKEWQKGHRWSPGQLRHNAATLLRREFGLEAAQLALGHASARITDAVYAERDQAKVVEIMRKIG